MNEKEFKTFWNKDEKRTKQIDSDRVAGRFYAEYILHSVTTNGADIPKGLRKAFLQGICNGLGINPTGTREQMLDRLREWERKVVERWEAKAEHYAG